MIYRTDLDKLILDYHLDVNKSCNRVLILSGWIGPDPIEKLAQNNIKADVIYGCFKARRPSFIEHKKYCNITNNTNVKVRYLNNYNHSKIYSWYIDEKINNVIAGSANFSGQGLKDYRETLFDIDCENNNTIDSFLKSSIENSILCTDYEFSQDEDEKIDVIPSDSIWPDQILDFKTPKINLFLGGQKGQIPDSSTINWGQGSSNDPNISSVSKKIKKRNSSAAYFRVSKKLVTKIPQFFPNNGINPYGNQGHNTSDHFRKFPDAEFLFDDGVVINMSFEGGVGIYNKFTSYQGVDYKGKRPSNHVLGNYLRKRIGVGPNEKVLKEHLIKYGKDYITFTKVGEMYTADFSVKGDNDFIALNPTDQL